MKKKFKEKKEGLLLCYAMIEIEKKVHLREIDLKKIEKMGIYLESRLLTDTYYDTEDFRYTTSDIWLRERECKFELKIGLRKPHGVMDGYEEVIDELEIMRKLGLEREKDLSRALAKAKICPYATFQTIRRKYQIGEFILDLDLAYFDDFIYRIAEIELIVHSESKIAQGEEAMQKFLQQMGIDSQQPVRAKLVEYLSQKNPTHYQALISSGIIA